MRHFRSFLCAAIAYASLHDLGSLLKQGPMVGSQGTNSDRIVVLAKRPDFPTSFCASLGRLGPGAIIAPLEVCNWAR
jgi:hypothetical protein